MTLINQNHSQSELTAYCHIGVSDLCITLYSEVVTEGCYIIVTRNCSYRFINMAHGSIVVKALCYKLEGCGFKTR
jgi:hypothetical protein